MRRVMVSGVDFRQFLLTEQARVEAVLQRLATTDPVGPPRLVMSITPTTVPNATMAIFGLLAAGLGCHGCVRRVSLPHRRALSISQGDWSVFVTRPLAATLLAMALLIVGWALIRPRTSDNC